jgi:hypothetical protein
MDVPEIERLLSEAIANRPKATKAPLNLYVYNNKIVCGTRTVMPKNARFIAHIGPDTIAEGFGEKQWQLVVEKTFWILKDNRTKEPCDFKQKRKEQRLQYSSGIWFSPANGSKTWQGQMLNVSSGGMAFTCYNRRSCPDVGQSITTQFTVPWFTPDGNIQSRKFTRTAKICRVNNENSFLKKIAVQFADPLPFQPAEQNMPNDADVTLLDSAQV